ncbi:MAG: ROK family protein [Acidimicrobiia bacterium]
MTTPVVGIDLGGTKVFGALVDPDGTGLGAVLADAKAPTPTDGIDSVLDAVEALVRQLDPSPVAVGIGTPGIVEPGTGRVLLAPNLAGFDRPVEVGRLLEERLGCPVAVGNDVNVAALGEARAGAGVGHDDILAVWLGTGLGAGVILDGRLRVGPHGLAGELGHAVVVPAGRRCGCGGLGHLEAYIGRRALEVRARELHATGRPTALVALAGDGPMKSKVFRAAYDAGDAVARELLDEGIALLGTAVVNVAVTVDIGAVVIGGGLGERFGSLVTDRVAESLRTLGLAGVAPVVVEASLGDHAGALGAARLVLEAGRDAP